MQTEKQILDKLRQIVLPITHLVPHQAPHDQWHESAFISHFGGMPYMERGEHWPQNRDTKQSLDFVMQLVAGSHLSLPGGFKVVQFFYDFKHPAKHWRQGSWRVKTYREIRPERLAPHKHSRVVNFCSIETGQGLSLPDWDSVDYILPGISRFCQMKEAGAPWDYYEKLRSQIVGSSEIRSFVGGYPQWIQGNAQPLINNQRAELLFQLDSEERAGIQWGNWGSVYLFLHDDRPNDYGFVWQTL